MSTWEWIKTVGIVTAMIIADIATDGLALIAEIVLALNTQLTLSRSYEFERA